MYHLHSAGRRLLLVLACALVVNGCDSPTGPPAVSDVSVTLPAGSMVVGETMTAVAVVRDASGNPLPDRAITWSSSDDGIAAVDGTGQVAALAPGVVTITARSEGREANAALTVLPVPVAAVEVSPDTATLAIGSTLQLAATPRDAAGGALTGRSVAWSSDDEAIARIAQDGTVTGVAAGTVAITAAVEGRSGTASITVTPPPLAAPTDVAVERRSRLRARVTWTGVADAERYRIERRETGGTWSVLETVAALEFTDGTTRSRGATYEYRVTALAGELASPPSPAVATAVPAVRLAMIGDSNLERGKSGAATVATSYVSGTGQAIDTGTYPDHPKLMSGKIMALRLDVEAVNHGIASTGTGTGTVWGHPHALHAISGVTRFEAEVLGRGFPWTAAGIPRVNAFTPTAADFAYYSLGINDIAAGMSPTAIRDNIAAAIDLWLGAGLPAAHLMVTTLGPHTTHPNHANIPITNGLIRTLIASRGVSLLDIAALVSADDGLTWKHPGLHTGSGLHYSEATLDLIAAEVVRVMGSRMP